MDGVKFGIFTLKQIISAKDNDFLNTYVVKMMNKCDEIYKKIKNL